MEFGVIFCTTLAQIVNAPLIQRDTKGYCIMVSQDWQTIANPNAVLRIMIYKAQNHAIFKSLKPKEQANETSIQRTRRNQ